MKKMFILTILFGLLAISCNQKKDIENAQKWLDKNLNDYYFQKVNDESIFTENFNKCLIDLQPFISASNGTEMRVDQFKEKWKKYYDVNHINYINFIFPEGTDFEKISIKSKFNKIENDSIFVFDVKCFGFFENKDELFCERVVKLVKKNDAFLINEVSTKQENTIKDLLEIEKENKENPKCNGKIVIDLVNEVVYEKYIADLTLIEYLKVEYPSILNAGRLSYSIEKGLQKMKSNISNDIKSKKQDSEFKQYIDKAEKLFKEKASFQIENIRYLSKEDELNKCDCAAIVKFDNGKEKIINYMAQKTEDGKTYIEVNNLEE